jgi:hypothetical protein
MISPFSRMVEAHFTKDQDGRLVFIPLFLKGKCYFVDSITSVPSSLSSQERRAAWDCVIMGGDVHTGGDVHGCRTQAG